MQTSSGYRLLLSATTAKLTAQWHTKIGENKRVYDRNALHRNICWVLGQGLNQGLHCAAMVSRQRGATNTALRTSATRPIRHGTCRPSVAFRHPVADDVSKECTASVFKETETSSRECWNVWEERACRIWERRMKSDQSDLQDEEQKPTGESFENDPLYGSTVGYQGLESKRSSD
jgi:hypothetical protein